METISSIVIPWQKLKSITHNVKFLTRTLYYITTRPRKKIMLTNILLMCIGNNIDGCAIDEEILETAHETITEGGRPDLRGKFKVRIHIIDASHEQTPN